MNIQEQIEAYIAGQPEAKRRDMQALHDLVLKVMPSARLWYLDGRGGDGKIVSNPNIGYGVYTIKYADGKSREFYQIGISANNSGISVYVMGIEDKTYLPRTYGDKLGKVSISGYCIKFRALKDIDMDVLQAVLRDGLEATAE